MKYTPIPCKLLPEPWHWYFLSENKGILRLAHNGRSVLGISGTRRGLYTYDNVAVNSQRWELDPTQPLEEIKLFAETLIATGAVELKELE